MAFMVKKRARPRRGTLLAYGRGDLWRPALIAVAAATLGSGAALAQQQQAANTDSSTDSAIEEVVVTGSMFKRTSSETASPVTTLTTESLDKQGIISIADAVRSVSADNSGTIPTAFGVGFAAGASGVALRGLTVNSTLVLIDGQRTANYALADDGQRGFVDLNTIPFGALDRVEVLKDGASSSYGADAIGGVVNVLLKKTFEGVEGTIEGGDTQHGGGGQLHFNVLAGYGDLDDDKYNFYVNVEGEGDDRIRVGERPYPFNTNDTVKSGGVNLLSGQPGQDTGSIYGTVTPATITGNSVLNGVPIAGALYQPLRPCGPQAVSTTVAGSGTSCYQNETLYTDDQPRQDRLGAYGRFTTKITDDIQAYLSMSYFENKVTIDLYPQQIQNSINTNTNSIALPATLPNGSLNPNDPFAAQGEAALINYAFGTLPSYAVEDNHVLRGVFDVSGDVWGWNFDATAVLAHTWLNTTEAGYLNAQQLISDVTNGTYNFVNPAANSPAVLAALSPINKKVSTSDLDSFEVTAIHPLWQLPGGPLSLGIGTGARYEATHDPNINPGGEYQGIGLAQTEGFRNVENVFLEIDAPLLQTVDADVSGRWDHYSDFGDAFTPKGTIKWTAIEGLVFRATAAQGFRAPSFSESGNSSSLGFTTYTPPASFAAAHGNDGYVAPYSLGQGVVANKNLQPETSNSFTLGSVFEPFHGYSISIDYYNIKKNHLIVSESQAPALNAYYAGLPIPAGYTVVADRPDPLFPNALPRPVIIQAPYANAHYLKTDGIDIDLRARFMLPEDVRLTSTLSFTDILNYKVREPDGTAVSYLGYQSPYNLSSGAGTPQYHGSWINSFDYGPANITLIFNYVSGIKEIGDDITENTACFENNAAGSPYPYGCRVKAFQDFDLTASYQINDQFQVYGAILNLFDKPPPFDPMDYASGGGGTYAVNYNPTYAQSGIIGRFFRLGMTYRFEVPKAAVPEAAPLPIPAPAPAPAPVAAAPSELKVRSYQVFFDFDKYEITTAAKKVIAEAAEAVKSGNIARIDVVGHTDTVGSLSYNLALSTKRAEAVKTELVTDGIAAPEIATSGVGKTGLLVPTGDGVREAQNRRAEIHLE